MENFDMDKELVEKVNGCSQDMAELLNRYFADDPSTAVTMLVYILVRSTDAIGIPPEQVINGLKEAYALQDFMKVQVDSEWVN